MAGCFYKLHFHLRIKENQMAILKSKPMLLRACEAGLSGINHPYKDGAITEALFTYVVLIYKLPVL